MAALTNRYEDDDASHLPPGMTRVGYDADTQRYTFREGDNLWLGEPGSLYGGQLKWAGRAPDARTEDEDMDNSSMEDNNTKVLLSVETFHDQTRRALSRTNDSQSKEDTENEWGVPVVSISTAGAEPPDSPKDESSLKRRATKLKKVATLTADALGVTRRGTKRDGPRRTR